VGATLVAFKWGCDGRHHGEEVEGGRRRAMWRREDPAPDSSAAPVEAVVVGRIGDGKGGGPVRTFACGPAQ
jgi:hypothetical protein